MIVEIILTSMCIVYPGRKENVVKTCNTHRFLEELACLSPCSVSHSRVVCGCAHTLLYTHSMHTYVPSFGGGEQRFGDNWYFFLKIIKFSKNHLTVSVRKAETVCGSLIWAEHKVSCYLSLPTFKNKFQEPIFTTNLYITFKFPVGKLSLTYECI